MLLYSSNSPGHWIQRFLSERSVTRDADDDLPDVLLALEVLVRGSGFLEAEDGIDERLDLMGC